MAFIKAKNGNIVEFEDADLGKRALADGHEVFKTDPRKQGAKKWEPEAADGVVADSE